MRLLLLCTALLLGACTSFDDNLLKGRVVHEFIDDFEPKYFDPNPYEGRLIQEFIYDFGDPVNAYDLPDGRRVFQWKAEGVYGTAKAAVGVSSKPQLSPGGHDRMPQYLSSNQSIPGGRPMADLCVRNATTLWHSDYRTWVILSSQAPGVICLSSEP